MKPRDLADLLIDAADEFDEKAKPKDTIRVKALVNGDWYHVTGLDVLTFTDPEGTSYVAKLAVRS